MGILLAFAPFIAFAIVDRLLGSAEGLCAGFAVSAMLLVRDWLGPDRAPKLLVTRFLSSQPIPRTNAKYSARIK